MRVSSSNEQAYRKLNQIVDRFNLSHTAVITPWVAKNIFGEGDKYHLGLYLQKIKHEGKNKYFIRSMMHGSAAREAGLLIGDEITSLNQLNIKLSPRLTLAGYEHRRQMYTIKIDKNEAVSIEFKRTKEDKKRTVIATANQPLSAKKSISKSIRLFPLGSDNVAGYIHLWNFMSRENATILKEALQNNFSKASGLVIDLRGRGGRGRRYQDHCQMLSSQKNQPFLLLIKSQEALKKCLPIDSKDYHTSPW